MTVSLEQNAVSSRPASYLEALACVADPIRVLFVENNHEYRETVVEELSERGFGVLSFVDGASFLDSLLPRPWTANGPTSPAIDADVIVLDWTLPKTSGIDLLSQLRRRGVNVPVVFLTNRNLIDNESMALDRRAINFIDKARGLEVLVRRLKRAATTLQPAAEAKSDDLMICGKLALRPSASRANWDDVDLGLTVGEYNIVHLLVSNVGLYMTYRAIYDCMHYEGFIAGYGNDGYRQNVRSAIKRIRNKFRECDPAFAEIGNYTAFGYCWVRPAGQLRQS